MKKVFVLLMAAMLIAGVTGHAMAAFELGNLQLVAYEEADNTTPLGSEGYEVHFDMGASLDVIDGTTLNTGISLSDFDTSSWDDIYVGIFGGGYASDFSSVPALFASATSEFTASPNTYDMFQSAALANSSMGFMSGAVQAKANGSYYLNFQMGGTSPGTYASLINAGPGFGGELQLADNTLLEDAMTMYSWEVSQVFGAASTGELSILGYWTLDTTGDELLVSYNAGSPAVPIPGAAVLLGSGLLGLVGIRSRVRRK